MEFSQVIQVLKGVVGKELQSIKPGASVTIRSIDVVSGRIELENSKGLKKSRPLQELEKIWSALTERRVVHVDSLLGGSGSSRNQPETILACLPCIEHIQIHGKKHLVLLDAPTHQPGTLRAMDPIAAEELRIKFAAGNKAIIPNILVVSSDLAESSKLLASIFHLPSMFKSETGLYCIEYKGQQVALADSGSVSGFPGPGWYPVVEAPPPGTAPCEKVSFGVFDGWLERNIPNIVFINQSGLCS